MKNELRPAREIEQLRRAAVPGGERTGRRNQRLSMRFDLRARVEFCWIDEKGISRHGIGLTRDVSTRGAYILGSEWPPEGTSVAMNIEIRFAPATSRVLRVQTEGRVVRVDRPGRAAGGTGFSVHNDRVTSIH